MAHTGVLTVVPGSLRCEYAENSLGVEACPPRLSWQVAASARNQAQFAYQILVASTPGLLAAGTGDLWDSGEVHSEACLFIPYAGVELGSGRRAYWAVRVWGEDGVSSPYSAPAWWEMGLLGDNDWQAQWIAPPHDFVLAEEGRTAPPSPLLRREIVVDKPVVSARVHLCGLGYSELYLNGQKVGDHVLDPVFTRYDQRALYVTYDLTGLIRPGANALGVMLGTGWYDCHTQEVWGFVDADWRDHPKLLLQLHLTFADGSEQVIVTDLSWQASTGPVVFDGLRNGEFYDARLEQRGWAEPGFDAGAWIPAVIISGPGGKLVSQQMPPCRVMQTLEPVSVTEVKPGVFVYDFGQNIVGWAQLRLSGPASTTVTLRYAEMLGADGDIDVSGNCSNAYVRSGEFQTDRYTLRGEGEEVWEPRFTYHGFQWVQVTGFPGTPTLENLRGCVVHTAFESAGEFSCSKELLNDLQRLTRWSYIGNYVGIPTDCPHREKNGWTGDALLAAETGLFNFTTGGSYAKWLDDFTDVQRPNGQLPAVVPTSSYGYNGASGPAWDSAYTHIPWYLYEYCGDRGILERHYAGMQRYLEFMTTMATGGLVRWGLGDLCAPGEFGEQDSPVVVTSTGYYYANARLVAAVAGLLGYEEDQARYEALAEAIRAAFNRAFYHPETGAYAGGDQTTQACALFQGLVEPGEEEKVLAQLERALEAKGIHFGILGAKYILDTLTVRGRAEVAYDLATRTDCPSWGWWVTQGATTLWEHWEGLYSRNHIFFGDLSAWMFKALAGIKPVEPGFKAFTIHPHVVGDLTWVRAEHRSPYGLIRSAWEKTGAGLVLEVEIPANTVARVYLPAADAAQVTESGKPLAEAEGVTGVLPRGGRVAVQVGSGVYRFEVKGKA